MLSALEEIPQGREEPKLTGSLLIVLELVFYVPGSTA